PADLDDDEQLEISFKADRAANDNIKPNDMTIHGVSDLMTTLAKCCQPVPGDRVLGFVTRGAGITIHRELCPNILYQQHEAGERVVEVNWGHDEERVYPMTVLITAFDRKGLLRDVSTVFADEKINVLEMSTNTDCKSQTVQMESLVEVTSFEAMSRLLAKLDHLPNVLAVKRKV
ncbi:MAG: bifunctional (p)ppGpp synthetase/guanosine-3',5'-bis(diphosphate) 3'-pyrophosphohydrolase, partial [Arenicella sp.]|nr:bifunctional (p)ppGpp synthetase/guanosine-3',5'-bis(diphosphate) 3'-pyrophosphohydrolase [Arenicella sp.]